MEEVNLLDEGKSGLSFVGRTLAKDADFEEKHIVTLMKGSVIADIETYNGLVQAGLKNQESQYLVDKGARRKGIAHEARAC